MNVQILDVWEFVDSEQTPEMPLTGWKLYYDETNNCRKFRIDPEKQSGYNCDRALTHDFILGGIALRPNQNPDVEGLIRSLGLESCTELKSKHVLKGDFIYGMGSDRVRVFLQWMVDNDILVHYRTIDNIYYSLIDLVDESCASEIGKISLPSHRNMKDDLYYFAMGNM